MTQPLVLSASSVATYLRCGQQWAFRYVHGIKSPPSLKSVRGTAVHKAVEVDMRQKMTSRADLPVDDMLDAYSDSWDQESSDGFVTDDDGVTPGQIKDKGAEMVRVYRTEAAPGIQPVMVEQSVQFEINGQPFSGQIDLATRPQRAHGRLVVRDTKTTARTPNPSQYGLNMVGYALSQRQATDEVEADTVLDYVIATKEPRYLPISNGGPVSDEQVMRFSAVVGQVAGSIKAGRFPPNGITNGACSWCGYRPQCPYALPD